MTLDAFFATMSEFFRDHSGDPEWLLERFPDWEASPERLAIYGGFVSGHVRRVTGKVYPVCRELTPPELWERWMTAYYATRPAGPRPRINGVATDFVGFLEGREDAPPFLADLARFELAKLEAYEDPARIPSVVDRPTVNPTLRTLELSWRVCRCYSRRKQGPEPPAEGEEVALVWRDPETRFTRFRAAGPRDLLALKIALEGLRVEQAAAAGGVEPAVVAEALRDAARFGLLLLPVEEDSRGDGKPL